MPRAAAEWPDWQFAAAVRHERTHIERNDLWANFIAHLACALWWFHPLVWMLSAQPARLQETACDDAVLSLRFRTRDIRRGSSWPWRKPQLQPYFTGCAMTTQTNVKTRIMRLLDRGIARTTSPATASYAVGFAVVLAPSAPWACEEPRAARSRFTKWAATSHRPHAAIKWIRSIQKRHGAPKFRALSCFRCVVGTDGLAHDISVVKSLDPGSIAKPPKPYRSGISIPARVKANRCAVRATIEINFRLL